MDLSPDDLDVSPPCFLVENSQAEESQQLGRSDSDQYLKQLKQLPIFRLPNRSNSSADNSTDRSSVTRLPVAVTCPTAGGEGCRKEEGDPSRQQRGGDQQGEGGNSSGGGGNRGGTGGGGDNGGGGGGEGGGGGAGGGGDGGGGGGGDDDDNENNGQDPSTNEEESAHSEEPSSLSSSDAIPRLIRPEAVVANNDQWKGRKLVVQVVRDAPLSGPDTSHGSGGSVHESSDNYSQASTGIVGEGRDVGTDVSEASTALVEEERKSTSSSSIGKTWVKTPNLHIHLATCT